MEGDVITFRNDFYRDWASLYHDQVKYYFKLQEAYQNMLQQSIESFYNFTANISPNFGNKIGVRLPSHIASWDCSFVSNFNKICSEHGLETLEVDQCKEPEQNVETRSRQLLFPCD